jgi:hypothetical protein
MESVSMKRQREEGSAAAVPPFRGPAADSRLGELFLEVIGLVAAMGFAADVSQCVYVCGLTFRPGDRGATNDVLIQSLRLQCGAHETRAAVREDRGCSTTCMDARLRIAPRGARHARTEQNRLEKRRLRDQQQRFQASTPTQSESCVAAKRAQN